MYKDFETALPIWSARFRTCLVRCIALRPGLRAVGSCFALIGGCRTVVRVLEVAKLALPASALGEEEVARLLLLVDEIAELTLDAATLGGEEITFLWFLLPSRTGTKARSSAHHARLATHHRHLHSLHLLLLTVHLGCTEATSNATHCWVDMGEIALIALNTATSTEEVIARFALSTAGSTLLLSHLLSHHTSVRHATLSSGGVVEITLATLDAPSGRSEEGADLLSSGGTTASHALGHARLTAKAAHHALLLLASSTFETINVEEVALLVLDTSAW